MASVCNDFARVSHNVAMVYDRNVVTHNHWNCTEEEYLFPTDVGCSVGRSVSDESQRPEGRPVPESPQLTVDHVEKDSSSDAQACWFLRANFPRVGARKGSSVLLLASC